MTGFWLRELMPKFFGASSHVLARLWNEKNRRSRTLLNPHQNAGIGQKTSKFALLSYMVGICFGVIRWIFPGE
jgi:hypothetical protein